MARGTETLGGGGGEGALGAETAGSASRNEPTEPSAGPICSLKRAGSGLLKREEEEEEESEYESEEEEAADGDFFGRKQWAGVRPGFCFKLGDKGVGYYKDVPYHVAQAEIVRDSAR